MATRVALDVDPDALTLDRVAPYRRAEMRPKRPRLAHVSSAATMANTTTPSRIELCVPPQTEDLELRVR